MQRDGFKCTAIEGQMQNEDRDRVIKEFRDGQTKILIATDVLSRGLDVSTVTLVINYDMPVEYQNPSIPNFERTCTESVVPGGWEESSGI